MPRKLLLTAHLHQFLNSRRNIFPTHETRLTSSPSYQKPGARPPWSNFLKTRTFLLVVGKEIGSLWCLCEGEAQESWDLPLHAAHEEAVTGLLLYAKHATKDVERVAIQSPDSDVLVLSVSHCEEIGCGELWFRTGFKHRIRYIPVHKIAARLGTQLRKAIPAFHTLKGCDSTSSLSGTENRNAWKVLHKDTRHQESLAQFGQKSDLDKSTANETVDFICSPYPPSKKAVCTADELRYALFCQKKENSESLLTPTSDSLHLHI